MKSLDLAKKYLGKQETAGSNDGPVLKTIRDVLLYKGAPPCSWCILFAWWILCRAYGPTNQAEYRGWIREALGFPKGWFPESCHDTYIKALALGMISDDGRPGDIFFLLDAKGHAHHAGFKDEGTFNGGFKTVEGNSNAGGSDNGDGVYARARKTSPCIKFLRLPDGLRA